MEDLALASDLPLAIARLIERITGHLSGRLDGFQDVELDLSLASSFALDVYGALRAVEPGQVVTYGQLADRIGRPGAQRAVGRAVAANPVALLIPCHRVVAHGRRLGGFSAPGGLPLKARLLAIEGVILS